ncbi:MBL fold metallo-hydrolase [Tenacibaculum sp. SG-28]|uniref:MBL fold metallo-hydrolase n=1 Tax=Tenacibaculum sp. SG-28 TaxID=754426 RepID=UPI000CF525EC|nr:MBL fold metallo-hydrolase [Tenacibaculum sp. SG-28]PQJ23548.1 pyrroloquinoline quinone biosynthesis protein PqqB [Tenacibaculum sp. SG-28]
MKITSSFFFFYMLLLFSCSGKEPKTTSSKDPFFVILGVTQDAGYPQISCTKECCNRVKTEPSLRKMVSSIGLVDPISNQCWIFDATPDFTEQVSLITSHVKEKTIPDGIFLTHGHIGHYTGLMYLGKEAMSAKKIPVYGMSRMVEYLSTNGPWEQLVTNQNIQLNEIKENQKIVLNSRIAVTPILVPHRDEYTETVGYIVQCNNKKALFIPDIDKWEKWQQNITALITAVDIAFLDATFYKNGEIQRDMAEVPHPFVTESMALFNDLSLRDKNKIHFIHFNHTNPLLDQNSEAKHEVIRQGYNVAKEKSIV